MPPTCSMLTELMLRLRMDRSAPSATILMPSPSRPLPLISRLEMVSWFTLTPAPTMIWITGPPLAIVDWILAPPKSMLIGPWPPLTRLITIGALTLYVASVRCALPVATAALSAVSTGLPVLLVAIAVVDAVVIAAKLGRATPAVPTETLAALPPPRALTDRLE